MAQVLEDEYELHQQLFTVEKKKPGYRYRLINVNSRNVATKLRQGYEIVQAKDPEKLALSDSTPIKKGADLDGTQRVSDVVLARISEEDYQKRVARNRALIQRQQQMITRDFDRDAGPLGFNPNRDPTGHATRYNAGVTQAQYDKEKMNDDLFSAKYGVPKEEFSEE